MTNGRTGQTGGGIRCFERHSEGAEVLQVLFDRFRTARQSRVTVILVREDGVETSGRQLQTAMVLYLRDAALRKQGRGGRHRTAEQIMVWE